MMAQVPLLLLVDDDRALCDLLRPFLESYGYRVMIAYHGRMAWQWLQEELPDLVILDVLMPVMDGITFCRQLRRDVHTRTIPVLFLSVQVAIDSKCRAYALQADDYLIKPFEPLELQCKIEAILRRAGLRRRTHRPAIRLDPHQRVCRVPGRVEPVPLTEQEHAILDYLVARPYQPVSAKALMVQALDYAAPAVQSTTGLRNLIQRLRRKLEPDPQRPQFIRTVHRYGYMLAPYGEGVPEDAGWLKERLAAAANAPAGRGQ